MNLTNLGRTRFGGYRKANVKGEKFKYAVVQNSVTA